MKTAQTYVYPNFTDTGNIFKETVYSQFLNKNIFLWLIRFSRNVSGTVEHFNTFAFGKDAAHARVVAEVDQGCRVTENQRQYQGYTIDWVRTASTKTPQAQKCIGLLREWAGMTHDTTPVAQTQTIKSSKWSNALLTLKRGLDNSFAKAREEIDSIEEWNHSMMEATFGILSMDKGLQIIHGEDDVLVKAKIKEGLITKDQVNTLFDIADASPASMFEVKFKKGFYKIKLYLTWL